MWRMFSTLLLPILLAAQAPSERPQQDPIQQRDLELKVKRPSEAKPQTPVSVARGYALVIGIAKYQNLDPSEQLQFPESDAEAIYRVLISQEGGAFPSENVHLLAGKQATLAAMREQLEDWLPSVAQKDDRVVVYFAGHGLVKNGRGYLAPWDVDPSQPDLTAYPMSSLGSTLANRVKAQWKVLLTDACHSGKINPETTNESVDAQLNKFSGFLTFTATTERQSSYEDPNLSTGFGLFTYFLVQAFKGAADNDPQDGVITAGELIEYVRYHVRQYAKERGMSQTPGYHGDYDEEMPVGYSLGTLQAGSGAPSMLGTAVIETNMDDVDVYIDGNLVGRVMKNKPLVQPGLSSGLHKIQGVKQGYEPDNKEEMIAPGQQRTITLRIRYVREIKKSALDLGLKGEALLLTHRSALNPLNIAPVNRSQREGDLLKARELFTQALKEDHNYSKAAFELGQANQLLSDDKASMEAYRSAIGIDPSYVDARLQYAGVLIENGDPDEAIRQMMEAVRLDPKNDEAYSMMSRAYLDKMVWDRCIEAADKAIELKASNYLAHLWKADALRQLGAAETNREKWAPLYRQAEEDYNAFLSLTNFSTPAYEWIAFHFVGFHLGSHRHADRQTSYDRLRSSGYLGVCLCEQKLGNPLRAKAPCERAIKYDPNDAIAYFLLGNVFRDLYNGANHCDYLQSARDNYKKMLNLNPHLDESRHAKDYLEQIDVILPALQRKGCS